MARPVARARYMYPLGPPSGFTVLPQVGPPRPAVMPEVGPPEVPVMARGGADVSVTIYNQLQLVTTSYVYVHALLDMPPHTGYIAGTRCFVTYTRRDARTSNRLGRTKLVEARFCNSVSYMQVTIGVT